MRSTSFPALGTTALLALTEDDALAEAEGLLRAELERLDLACSRFRDSELTRANARAGRLLTVSPLLAELVDVALAAAAATDGLVDPTVGSALRAAGYDRAFALVRARNGWTVAPVQRRAAQWREVELDARRSTLRTPAGVELDLGATAKAWAADRAAGELAAQTGSGVLVSLGGDVAVAGAPPPGGWAVRLADDHASPLAGPGPVVAIESGGLATSSTTVRRWRTDDGDAHHLIDPATGRPASSVWRTASVAAASCADANVAATAAILLSESAPAWLDARALPARLVRDDGRVTTTGGWPGEAQAA